MEVHAIGMGRVAKQAFLQKYLSLFVSDKRAEGRSPRYLEWLRWHLERFCNWHEVQYGNAPTLYDFTAATVREFVLHEQERGRWPNHPFHRHDGQPLSDATLRGMVRAFKVFSTWLFQEGHLRQDALATVKVPKAEQRELVPLTVEEEKKLISACDDRTHAGARRLAVVLLMLDTGIRRGELLDFGYQDVHLDEGYITVIGKGGKQRSIPFGRKTERALRRYDTLYREPATIEAEDYFFLDMDGYPMTVNGIKMMFERLKARTGIERLHPHLLRHTYGIRNVEGNVSTLVIQARMGHCTPKVTERYTHAAHSEKVKRDRSFSHVDQLEIRVRKAPIKK